MRFAFVALAACGGSGPVLVPEAACPDCGPGEIRYALTGPHVQTAGATLDARGDGTFSYITDHAVSLLDATLVEEAHADLAEHRLAIAVAGNGDSTYVLASDTGKVHAASVIARELSGFDQSGQRLWREDIDIGSIATTLLADTLGPYAALDGDVAAYDLDGVLRASFTSSRVVSSFLHGGLIAVTDSGNQAVIADLFPTGPARWSHPWTAVDGSMVRFLDAATTAAGRVGVIALVTGRTFDLDGTQLVAPAAGTFDLVALLEPDGAVRWATLIPAVTGDPHVAVTSDDQIAVGGTLDGDGTPLGLPAGDGRDAVLALVDRTGIVHAELLGGPGDQALRVLRAGDAGEVVLAIANASGTLTIGAHALPEGVHDFVVAMLP